MDAGGHVNNRSETDQRNGVTTLVAASVLALLCTNERSPEAFGPRGETGATQLTELPALDRLRIVDRVAGEIERLHGTTVERGGLAQVMRVGENSIEFPPQLSLRLTTEDRVCYQLLRSSKELGDVLGEGRESLRVSGL